MKIRLFFLSACILVGILALNLSWKPVYNQEITTTSIGNLQKIHGQKMYTIQRQGPQNIWYLSVPKEHKYRDICVRWKGSESETRTCIDFDGDDTTDTYFTFPAFLPASRSVAFEIESSYSLDANSIKLHSINTNSIGKKLVFEPFNTTANPYIISRSGWGADESLRYAESPAQQKNWKNQLSYIRSDKTQKQINSIMLNRTRRNLVANSGGKSTETQSIQYTENGNRLVWPIEKTRQKNQIVIHHTDQKTRGLSDDAMIRGVYRYHAVSRGWGDIGYNYIVGQNGRVYEGRAGGDYVVGAHALYNNKNSIGISVLGDYNTLSLNQNQKNGLQEMIQFVAKKYGITLTNRVSGWKRCTTKSCKILQRIHTYGLVGHTHVGNTSCPGDNIRVYIPFWRKMLDAPYTPVLNTLPAHLESEPADQKMNMTLKKENTPPNVPSFVSSKPVVYSGKKIKIKLSYPQNDFVQISHYKNGHMFAFLDGRRKPIYGNRNLKIYPLAHDRMRVEIGNWKYEVKQFSVQGNIVQIDSWNRTPAWDTAGKYTDNVFRDTIHIHNQGGKLILVNELPIEWYLKGLGEVGNADSTEKIKTIAVAARGYAYYYTQPKNRKYSTTLYDGSDDPESFQQYLGYSYEMRAPRVARLVDATKNEVIYLGGELIKPWYFNESSGKTRSYQEYCTSRGKANCSDISYLQSVDDPAGKGKTQKGHGVGISGIGASYWAKQGWNYKKIIAYYLSGTTVRAYR